MNKEKNQTGTKSLLGKPVSIRDYEPPQTWIDNLRSDLYDEEENDEEELYDSE